MTDRPSTAEQQEWDHGWVPLAVVLVGYVFCYCGGFLVIGGFLVAGITLLSDRMEGKTASRAAIAALVLAVLFPGCLHLLVLIA